MDHDERRLCRLAGTDWRALRVLIGGIEKITMEHYEGRHSRVRDISINFLTSTYEDFYHAL